MSVEKGLLSKAILNISSFTLTWEILSVQSVGKGSQQNVIISDTSSNIRFLRSFTYVDEDVSVS